jgi:hypothetical protein
VLPCNFAENSTFARGIFTLLRGGSIGGGMFIETQFFTIKISQQRKLISRMLGEHHYSFFFSFFSFFSLLPARENILILSSLPLS